MTTWAKMALLLCLAVPAAVRGDPDRALERALLALQENDLEGARAVIEPALARAPDRPEVLAATGILRFYEQRYADAVTSLEKSGIAGGRDALGAGEILQLARAAREITQDYARAESEHFVVMTPKGKDEVLVPYGVATLAAQRRALERDLGGAPPGKVTIEFLDDTRTLARMTQGALTEEEIKTSGTIAICKYNKLMVVSPKALLTGYEWLDTAAHEYVHYALTYRTRDNAPIWLQEGIAKVFEGRWRGTVNAELSPYAGALLRDAAKRNKLITFKQMYPSMAKLPSQEATALAFAEVAAAVEYLQKKNGAVVMKSVLDQVAAGKSAEEAVARALNEPFAKFMEGWRRYLTSRPMPSGGDRALRQLRFKDDSKRGAHSEWAEIPDEKSRGYARLGEIMRARGNWEAARIEYAKAIERVGARIAVLSDKFALVAILAGHESDAEAVLVEASQANPHYAALHVHLARLRVKQKLWSKAKEELLLANRTDPFDPEIHDGLAKVLEAQGDVEGASRERRFGKILSGHQETK